MKLFLVVLFAFGLFAGCASNEHAGSCCSSGAACCKDGGACCKAK